MCGIAGWLDWQVRPWPGVLGEMSASVACRGPDADGVFVAGPLAFAHRRLIVVDPEGGGQPMLRGEPGRRRVLIYNGELYNTEDLRRELAARGEVFRGHSDTEVLLAALTHFGREAVEHLNGIFAFAFWDEAAESLLLARDRLGVKPLFYAERNSLLVFGSELKAVLAHPAVAPEVDAEGLAEVLTLGPARTPGHGVFRGVNEVLPGTHLLFTRRGRLFTRYWRLRSEEHPDDAERTVRRVRELLADTVGRQLIADRPVATLLSGGLDSSAVTALAVEALGPGKALKTFSVDFVDMERYFRPGRFQTNLDSPWVERVAAYLGTEHQRILLDTPDLVEALPAALRARDLPGMADVDASLLLFSRELKKEVTVALSGEAADEVFGGYPWLFHPEALAADTFPWARRLSDRVRILSPEARRAIRPEEYLERRYREALAEVPRLPGEDPEAARRREIMYLNLTRFLPTLLDRKDRMSMAAGLEVRVPFCDHRLVEYVWNIPWEMKTLGGRPKGVLREALRGLLPEDVLNRPKSPYPSTPNPSYLAAMREWALRVLAEPDSPVRELLDLKAVRALAEKGLDEPDLPWFGQLMGLAQLFSYLIQLDLWFRDYGVHMA